MDTYKLEACSNGKQFIFEFWFKNEIENKYNTDTSRYVSYRLLRNDKPNDDFKWEGCLSTSKVESFELLFPDEIDIKGNMQLFMGEVYDYIWIDTHYCYRLEEHFEGNILEISKHTKHPINPIPPIPEPNKDIVEQEIIVASGYNDLFPYLYIKKWPNLTEEEQGYLMYFVNNTKASTSLYNTYLTFFNDNIPKKDARNNIITTTFNFVNGIAPFNKGQYITNTTTLPEPYCLFPVLYDHLQTLQWKDSKELILYIVEELNLDKDILSKLITTKDYLILKDRVWQNVFALSVLDFYNSKTLENDIKILLVCNILQSLLGKTPIVKTEITHLLEASLVLPFPVFPLPPISLPTAKKQSIVIPYAIGDLHMTQHKLIGYQPGEVAHIENVLPGEIKERRNSSLNEITETSVHTDITNFKNTQNIEGTLNALTKAIHNTLKGTDTTEDDYSNLTTTYGPPTTNTLNGTVTKTRTPKLIDNTSHADFAKKVLNKAVNQMGRSLKQVFTKNEINKTEEAVIHTLDNRNKDKSIRGIYNWVNKVYETRVIDYGNRFLLEFLIEHPFPIIEANATVIEKGLIAPANRTVPITSFKDITRENYALLAADYGVLEVPVPPNEFKSSYSFFNEDNVLTAQMMPIEEGYVPDEVQIGYSITTAMEVLVGPTAVSLSTTSLEPPVQNQQKGLSITNPVAPVTSKIDQKLDKGSYNTPIIPIVVNQTTSYLVTPIHPGFYISVAVNSTPSSSLMNTWKVKVYDAIIKAYQSNIEKSKDQIDRLEQKNKVKREQWIQRAIKENCKEILYTINLEKNEKNNRELSVKTISEANESQPSYDQFFEQALEWEESVYEFYDLNHPFLISEVNLSIEQMLSNQSFFERFNEKQLRVMIPVCPQFNYKILYYLKTGLISYIQDKVTPIITEDQSIAVAIKKGEKNNHTPSTFGKPWKIEVPTNMQWLQENNQLPFTN